MQLAAFARIVSCMYTVVSAQLVPYGAAHPFESTASQGSRVLRRGSEAEPFRIIQKAQLSPGSSVGHRLGRDDLMNHVQALH